ncbi:hypothetical protein L228DRAFT_285874 [Xylona heveae TC161]|uniref:Protein required for cell viability n=1 Tax=Xylona heveae (strain CBS 132557 / TC161) TaxID=1328760 RepID=A0A164ZST6_XYLHT|nr:hypothetical protein L228DRAFT_285874 [Xylona heveae TC161]KZF19463.1 hypothetical protein L228DRAFT_285874 [Xylona heveae TC161]
MTVNRADASLEAAEAFLAPVFSRKSLEQVRAQSFIERLSTGLNADENAQLSPKTRVLKKASSLLVAIHKALIYENDTSGQKADEYLYEPKRRRIVNGLFDLISLEGIYPSLSPGVGIPVERRVKSVLPAGVVAKPVARDVQTEPNSEAIRDLQDSIDALIQIAQDDRKGLEPLLRDRTLVDLICGAAELAYGPSSIGSNKEKYDTIFKRLLANTPTSSLLPILTSLLQPTTPEWLRPRLSTPLSLLPLRPRGVRHTIEFLASTAPPPPPPANKKDESIPSRGPPLPLEAITQASKLLSSVPKMMTAEAYFSQIAPQLLSLLDGEDGPEMSKAAGVIIGGGILGRRIYGAPRTIGWKCFVEPVLGKVDPGLNTFITESSIPSLQNEVTVLVSESELKLALQRLSTLLTSHPNPGLTKRLLTPVKLPLWALLCSARDTDKTAYSYASSLLYAYFKVSAGTPQMIELSEDIMYDGRSWWTYEAQPSGEIAVISRNDNQSASRNMVQYVEQLDKRVDEYIRLVCSDDSDKDRFSTIFLAITRRWLLDPLKAPAATPNQLELGPDNSTDLPNSLKMLANAKLVQTMLIKLKDKLAESPGQLFELVQQLLETFIENDKAKRQRIEAQSKPSISGLSSIVQPESDSAAPGISSSQSEDPSEIASIALSLLSTILSSPGFSPSARDMSLLSNILPSLAYLSSIPSIPSSLSMAATNLSSLISLHASLPQPTAAPTVDPHAEDRKTHQLALTYLTDPVPPVRAQGLSLLTGLISSRSPTLDIPVTTILLLGLLQDEDEYIYLNAIKSLSLLSQTHSRTVIKTLLERYVDRDEELSLDQRLRLGEALLKTVEGLAGGLVGETAKMVGEATLAVAGRRGRRVKAHEEREKKIKKEDDMKREAEDAWGGEVPQFGEDDHDEGNEDSDQRRQREIDQHLAQIIEGWQGTRDSDDVRVRTSALSILGAAIETNVAGLGSLLTSSAVDLAIAVLTLETADEKIILRRAAVLLVMSLLRALDKAQEQGIKLGFGLAGENLAEVIRVLKYIEATDRDEIVVGHARTVVEEMEVWQGKSLGIFGTQGIGPGHEAGEITEVGLGAGNAFGEQGVGIAGLAINPESQQRTRPRIEEIE